MRIVILPVHVLITILFGDSYNMQKVEACYFTQLLL